jgi:hypothetical protein
LLLVGVASSALAGAQPILSVVGGTGVPGGTVSVTLALAGDVGSEGVSAGVDLNFPDDILQFFTPVSTNCDVAARLMTTHAIAGSLLQPGVLNVEIFVLGTPSPIPPLGDGTLATCDFRIQQGVSPGTIAPLTIESPFLGDDAGQQIPVQVQNGQIEVVVAPTVTPTFTPTTAVATATVTATRTTAATSTVTSTPTTGETTATVTGTPTDTPETQPPTRTVTATRTVSENTETPVATFTNTPPSTPTRTGGTPTATSGTRDNDDGCNVVPPGDSDLGGTLALLLAPALLVWARRRSAQTR